MPIGAAIGAATIGAGASLVSSSQQANATKSAAATQQQATDAATAANTATQNRALDLQQSQYDQTRADLQPYAQAGTSALDQLTQELQTQPQYAQFDFAAPPDYGPAPSYGAEPDYGKLDLSADAYKESPGLQTSISRGISDLNSQYAAKGLLGSGAAAKAIADYATGSRMADYNTWAAQQTDQYNNNRNFLQSDYNTNRNFQQADYQNNRNFLQSNYNTNRDFAYQDYVNNTNLQVGQRQNMLQSLYQIAGIGQNAANGTASAGATNASNQGNLLTSTTMANNNLLTSNANAQGTATNAAANYGANGLTTAAGLLGAALNKYGSSYGTPSTAAANSNPSGIPGISSTGVMSASYPGLVSNQSSYR